MSLLAIAPEIPTQTPGVLAPQKYKSWLTIDSKNSNVTEIVSQLGIASALFSAGETRAKKSRGGAGNFYLVVHDGKMFFSVTDAIAPMISAEGTRN